jgi:hypothetical protein
MQSSCLTQSKDLDHLKWLVEVPKLFLNDYFSELRREVDLAFVKKISLHEEFKNDLSNTWKEIIAKCDSLEQECLRKLTLSSLDEIKELIALIEQKQLNNNNDHDHNMESINDLILKGVHKFEALVFLNKTIFFKENLNYYVSRTTAGRLEVIPDNYLGREYMQSVKTQYVFLRTIYSCSDY